MAGQYRCGMCGASFNTEPELKEHNKTHMAGKAGQTAGQYRCGMCGASFNTEPELKEHNKTHMAGKGM